MRTVRSGDEALARWRIQPAVWAGRMLAAFIAVVAAIAFVNGGADNWRRLVTELVLAGVLVAAAEGTRRGSRAAAIGLLLALAGLKYVLWLFAGIPVVNGILIWAPASLAFASGIWGTFSLAAARREAEDR